MKVNGFKIESFAKSIYTQNQTPEKQGLNGRSLVIHGPNTSGKSLTYNALLYGLLGLDDRLGVKPGSGNDVKITFSDGSRFSRGGPREYRVSGEEYRTEEAENLLRDRLGDIEVIRAHFLPSHLDRLPLENISKSSRIGTILRVTDRPAKEEADALRSEIDDLDEEQIQRKDRLSPLERQKNRLETKVSNLSGYRDEWDKLLELCDNGRLSEISEQLSHKEDVKEELNSLSQRKRGLQRKVREKRSRITELQTYESEIEQIIVEALKEFVCPVCDQRVDSGTAESRLSRSNTCPFCNQDHSIDSLKNHLSEKKNENEGEPERLATEIAEHETEIGNIESEIEQLESEVPNISDLNSLAVDKIKEGLTEEEIRTEAEEELEKIDDELNDFNSELSDVEADLESVEQRISDIEEVINEKEARLEEIRDGGHESAISSFESLWSTHLRGLTDEPEMAVSVNRDSGDIALPGGEDGRRLYDRRGDLSDSEIQLLNLSFSLTLNDLGNQNNAIDWNTLLLDEPFSHLDSDRRDSALSYLLELDKQVILTSSSERIIEAFDTSHRLQLRRADFEQSTLSESGEWGA